MSFGSRLKDARKAKKLTQGEVALKLGIDDTTISKYENDKSEPDNETLKRLSALYGCSIDHLMGKSKLSVEDQAKAFSESLDLADRDVLNKFNFFVDGVPLTEEQIKKFLAYVRIERATDS